MAKTNYAIDSALLAGMADMPAVTIDMDTVSVNYEQELSARDAMLQKVTDIRKEAQNMMDITSDMVGVSWTGERARDFELKVTKLVEAIDEYANNLQNETDYMAQKSAAYRQSDTLN